MNYELRIKNNAGAKNEHRRRVHNSLFIIPNSGAWGYTLIELMVTIGIIGLISSIILANYPKFSEQLAVSQTAQSIALALREAKTYAIAVRQYCPPTGDCSFNVGYGVHFDTTSSPGNFILYAAPLDSSNICLNSDSDCRYVGNEVDTFTIKSGIQLVSICDLDSSNNCFNKLDVAYTRPDLTVYITGFNDTGDTQLFNVGVVVRGPGGQEKMIKVSSTGQISVQ